MYEDERTWKRSQKPSHLLQFAGITAALTAASHQPARSTTREDYLTGCSFTEA
jgi:hypothetical protein